jgi:hypothetical protein
MKLVLVTLLLSTSSFASAPPCSKWEFLVRAHEVQAYQRDNGVSVSKAQKKEYCKLKFQRTEKWQERFTDKAPNGWPNFKEKFKPWSQLEKEVVLKHLNKQPYDLVNLDGITFLRGVESSAHPKNPGASVHRLNAVALYDEFFKSNHKSEVISHELSHIFMYKFQNEKMDDLIFLMGWKYSKSKDNYFRDSHIPLLKEDSKFDIYEDIANHFEVYLHNPKELQNKNLKAFQKLQEIVGPQFKLEK